jgi:adenosylcobinamide-GDP ribazoletransferase
MVEALHLLTFVPGGADRPPRAGATVVFFPVVGLAIGVLWALPGVLLGHKFPAAGVTAALVLLLDAAITRGMHLAAIANVADAAASRRRGDDGLAIMGDPTVGAMGAAALILVCLLRYGALTFASEFAFRVLAAPVVGRAAMVLLIAWLPPLEDGSVAHRLCDSSRLAVVAAAVVAVAAVLVSGPRGVWALVAGLVAVAVYGAWLQGRFGALSRDGVGAGALVAETVALVVLSAN